MEVLTIHSTGEEVEMKRLLIWIVLALFARNCFGVITRDVIETSNEAVPQFIMTNALPPDHQFTMGGFDWINESPVSCHLVFYVGTTVFWIVCDEMESVQGDLKDLEWGKPVILRVKKRWIPR